VANGLDHAFIGHACPALSGRALRGRAACCPNSPLGPTRIRHTADWAGNSPTTFAHAFPITQLLQTPLSLGIMRLPGRLVQLVRILGRHPRGRRFESCTAHQNSNVAEPRVLQRKGALVPFLCWQALPDSFLLHATAKMRNRVDIPPILLLRQALLRAILAGFGMGSSELVRF
jgi:hypothetical protein